MYIWIHIYRTGIVILVMFVFILLTHAQGISPEQIYQNVINMSEVLGTWEALPEDHPLEESKNKNLATIRDLLTIRQDGTCRIFDETKPNGVDGIWELDDHELRMKFRDTTKKIFFIYGIRNNFMVTRSETQMGKHQLWAKVK
jgi:hypothetical protein